MQSNDPLGVCVEFVVALVIVIWTLWLLTRIARAAERTARAAERAAHASEYLARARAGDEASAAAERESALPLMNRRGE